LGCDCSFCGELDYTPLRMPCFPYGLDWAGYMVAYPLLTYLFLHKHLQQQKAIVLAILIGCCCQELPYSLWHFKTTLGAFPDLPIRIGAVLAGWWFTRTASRTYRWYIAIGYVVAAVLIIVVGAPLWERLLYSIGFYS
jgi:uncharacterized membrane protein YadS